MLPGTLRLGLADSLDPREIQAGSGASASLLDALRTVVADVVPISGGLPRAIARPAHLASVAVRLRPGDIGHPRAAAKRAHGAAKLGLPTTTARSLLMHRALASCGHLDAVVQRSSDMLLPAGVRVVTLEDSTVLQAWRGYPWPHLNGLSEGDIRRYAARQRRVYERASACCCATHWVQRSIIEDYGIAPERVFTVGMGQNHEARTRPERDWSSARYLFVGVDWNRKNGPAVLRAFARVRELRPDARLDVVGGHPPIDQAGVTGHGLLSLVEESDREQLADLYARATAFVMPSLHEPAGLVYVEAAGAGVASIGTSDGGAATMIGPGGIIVDPREDGQILDAMLRLADPETARSLGELAHAHAALLTWRKIAERIVRATALPGLDTSGLADFL
jgi:glycosyltransferase involved in cell wall biosynthesis